MAIVQISRIQLRRGKKNTDSGLPQLASGEMAWAIDEQGLYIGNGAVSEGAPAVGNTKILTEHDNLFELSDQYIYRNGLVDTGDPAITRSLQDRLDDFVSVRAFGATGDGDDQTDELQKAIDELFAFSSSMDADALKKRVSLKIHAGRYKLSDSIKIPPYATIIGDGSDKTVIEQTDASKPVFEIVDGTGKGHTDASTTSETNQARRIKIQGLTLQTNGNTGLIVYSTKDSEFEDIKLLGTFDVQAFANNQNAVANKGHTGIYIRAKSAVVNTIDNIFRNITIEKFDYAVRCNDDIDYNIFDQASIIDCGYGIVFAEDLPAASPTTELGFQSTGPTANKITNSRFQRILKQGIWIKKGKGNISENNVFKFVGTDDANDTQPKTPVIEFTAPSPNVSMGDAFYRTEALLANTATISNVAYIPEVAGYWTGELEFNVKTNIGKYTSFSRIFKLPADQDRTYKIDYTYNSQTSDSFRSGTLEIIVDKTNDSTHLTDTFDTTGSFSTHLQFNSFISDENGDTTKETLIVQALNPAPVPDNETAELTLKIKSIS